MQRNRRAKHLPIGGAYLITDIVAVEHGPKKSDGVASFCEVQRTNVNRLCRHLISSTAHDGELGIGRLLAGA